jgi:hypothetical protein
MERTELYGLPRQDFLFVLKNVACTPKTPRQKEVITIKGEVDLLKIPFYAPVWVIASVTYPEKWWEFLLGSPTVHEMTVAIGGKFEIKFAEGFDRDGEYSLAVNLYFGPTITTTMGTLKSVTLPPLPSLDTYEAKFTVSGELPPEEKLYEPLQPKVSPANPTEGTLVTITCPIVSHDTQAATIKVTCDVCYGSILSGPGAIIKTYQLSDSIQPGQTKNFTFTHTEVAPNDGKRDIVVSIYVDSTLKGYEHFDDAYSVATPAVNFTIGQPTASPATVLPGQTVTITCPITSACTSQQTVTVKVNIYEGSALAGAGTLLSTKTSPSFSIAPGQSYNVIVTDTAVQGTIDRRDVGVEVYIGANKVASGQFDDVFYVTAAALAFDLGQPAVSPVSPSIGQAITITCPVVSRCSTTQSITTKVRIDEGSTLGTPGSPIETFTSGPSSIAPNGTLNVVINTTAKGATDRKDIEVWVYVDGVEKAYEHFDDAFWVISPPYPSAEVRNVAIVSYPAQLKMGDTCNVKIRFEYQGPDQTRTLYAAIGNYGWAGFDEILSGSKAVRLSAKSSWTTYEDTVPIVITQAVDPAHSPYSLYAKVDGAVSSVLSNVITITEVVTGYKLTTGVRPAGVGYVTRSPDRTLYVPGETVMLTAYRSVDYYYFDFWSGDASGIWGQVWVIMDRDKSVTANFKNTPYP